MREVVDFASLFAGRTEAYGSEEGGCVRKPVTLASFHRHLVGVEPLGIYPIRPINGRAMVKWGCTDIDVEDLPMARRLQGMLEFMGINAYLERSRSKGWHVWVFLSEWTPAAWMRRTLLLAHERSQVPAIEINPKQESLEGLAKGFGNYVRAPYPGALGQLESRESSVAGGPPGGRGELLHTPARAEEQASWNHGCDPDDRQGRSGTSEVDSVHGGEYREDRQVEQTRQREGHLLLERPGPGGRDSADVGAIPLHGRATSGADRQVLPPVDGSPRPIWATRTMLNAEDGPVALGAFLASALGSLVAPEALSEYAGLWTPPEPRYVHPGANGGPLQWPEGEAAELARKAGGLAYTIFKEGPLEGSDRSTTMARLAHLCADNGLSPTEVFKILAGLPWSKFVGRSDHDEQILKLVEGAF